MRYMACKECKFWGFSEEHYPKPNDLPLPQPPKDFDFCVLSLTYGEEFPELSKAAFAIDSEGYCAALVTNAEFGCLRFTPNHQVVPS